LLPGHPLVLYPLVGGSSLGSATVGRRTEEPIHDRRATLDDGTDLMPVDEFRHARTAVTTSRDTSSIGTPASESSETNECRSSRGVHSSGFMPGTEARARRKSRRTFAVPSRVVNTKPVSCHWSPAGGAAFGILLSALSEERHDA